MNPSLFQPYSSPNSSPSPNYSPKFILGAEFANAVSGVIVGNGAVVHTREQMMPEVVQLVFRMGAPVAKEHTIGDWEPKVMGKQPAIFFCVDHEFWLVRDALGPGYRVRTRNAPIQDVSLTLAALNCIIRCKCTLANHYLQHA